MHQLYNSVLNNNECRKNLTTNVILITRKYNVLNYLLSYVRGGTFPHKNAWKSIVNDHVYIVEETKWKTNLIKKGAVQFSNIQTRLKPSIIYQVIKRDLHNKDKYMLLLQLLALPEIDLPLPYGLCNNHMFNVAEHMLTSCTALIQERNDFWDILSDCLSIHAETDLFNKEDQDIVQIMLGKD